jgi:hypothetical protein
MLKWARSAARTTPRRCSKGKLVQKTLLVSPWLAALAVMGCTASSGQFELEVRHTAPHVSGSSFQCTGTWPSRLTPCEYTWTSQPHTSASSPNPGTVSLFLGRIPIPIDGGASMVDIKLTIGADGQMVSATAKESTSSAPSAEIVESSDAVGGWVDPDAVSAAPDARSSGAFAITFPFGTISGTYDTADTAPQS